MGFPRRAVWSGILAAGLAGAATHLSAQDQPQPPAASAPATAPAHDLSQLKLHKESWPAQLTLAKDVQLAIMSNGQKIGAITSPAGATVDLISVDDTTIEIGVVDARASVAPEDTDLWQRIDAQAQKAPAAGAPPLPAAASAGAVPPPAPATNATPVPVAAPPMHTPTAPMPAPASPAPAPATADLPPAPSTGPALTFDYSAASGRGVGFTKADFRFWSPAYDQPIRGVIVLVPGFNGDGRNMVNNPDWQAFARKYRMALVGCSMTGGAYYEAVKGTGDALESALGQFAQLASRDEISKVPLLLYGESAGGQFDYDFVLWKPDRVIAFIVNKGGYYIDTMPDSHTCSVPGLFILGQSDKDFRITAITNIWTTGRKNGAFWALAPQPNSGHEFSKTPALARTFFAGVLKTRLPDDAAVSQGNSAVLNPLQENQGWVGDLTTHEIRAETPSDQPPLDQAWLPDQDSAQAWKIFVSGGK